LKRNECLQDDSHNSEEMGKTAVLQMVQEAVRSLKEPGGSSLHAIKQYVTTKYNLETETLSPAINEKLNVAVAFGRLLQPTGRRATG
jgi:3-oxoacyl-ACP reductase-like protein